MTAFTAAVTGRATSEGETWDRSSRNSPTPIASGETAMAEVPMPSSIRVPPMEMASPTMRHSAPEAVATPQETRAACHTGGPSDRISGAPRRRTAAIGPPTNRMARRISAASPARRHAW